MRREVTLDALHPTFSIELVFTPTSIIVLNNTDQSVYLSIGGLGVPSAAFYDREILPTSAGIPANVALPNNSYQFAGYLPTPGDTTKNVKIIFQGTADPYSNKLPPPFNNIRMGGSNLGGSLASDLGAKLMGQGGNRYYKEYTLNELNQLQVVDLPVEADMIFILNNSDATMYMGQGGTQLPNADFNDIGIPPKSYSILEPHGGWQYGLNLDSPSEKDCFVIFAFGYADEYAMLRDFGYIPPLFLQYNLNMIFFYPFASTDLVVDFTYVIAP